MDVRVIAGGDELYLDVFMGDLDNVDTALLDVSTLTAAEVDSYGWVKPGVPLQLTGGNLALITAANQTVYTVTPSPIQLRGRYDNANLAADTRDIHAQAPTTGAVQRKAMEKNLGRVLSANEIAGFALPGCKIQLIP